MGASPGAHKVHSAAASHHAKTQSRSKILALLVIGAAVAVWVQQFHVKTSVLSYGPVSPPPPMPEPRRECIETDESKELPWLIPLRRWSSSVPQPRESIGIITQLSSDRLSMLENQCQTWPDTIVAAVHVPVLSDDASKRKKIKDLHHWEAALNATQEDVILGIDAFHTFMERSARCSLDILLLAHFMPASDPEPYPINALRNHALVAAKTDLVMVLDVDFMATGELGMAPPGYRAPAAYNALLELASRKTAIVLPAFEITNRQQDLVMGQNYARNMLMAGKAEMQRRFEAGAVDAFNGHDFPKGHGPTNTAHWISLPPGAPPYRIAYELEYEPFVIMARHLAPWFDERFIGYGGNKIAYINQLHGLGFEFYVHPSGFSMHVPHPRTRLANQFVARKRKGVSEMENLRLEVEQSNAEGKYVPVLASCKLKPLEPATAPA